MVERLIREGADVNGLNVAGHTPLHMASIYGCTEVVAILIKAGAKVNARTNDENLTPLIHAQTFGSTDAMKLLVKAGAEPELRNRTGWDARDCAQKIYVQPSAVEVLDQWEVRTPTVLSLPRWILSVRTRWIVGGSAEPR